MVNLPTFIHIPRTGGTAVGKALGYPPNREQHKPWWAYEKLDRPWTIVRCPFDRAVSLCAFLLRIKLREREALTREEFEVWLHSGMPDSYGRIPILYPETLYPMHVCAPQMAFWSLDGASMMAWLWMGSNWSETWKGICAHLKMNVPVPSKDPIYTSARRETAYYYTDKTAALVRKLYAVDFETFGFDEEVE